MRTLFVVFCALSVMSVSLCAKRRMPVPASQQTEVSKQHKAEVKKVVKSRKAPKHRQSVN